ncbi:MAG: peptidase S41, partial [Sphingobium yanoikuyae]|nr:peptidase S41 [Sphingobium yanoikuyae]
ADLRAHLINNDKVDDSVLEDDQRADPRFAKTADQLKKEGVDDFQLSYALQTISRLGPKTQVATKSK